MSSSKKLQRKHERVSPEHPSLPNTAYAYVNLSDNDIGAIALFLPLTDQSRRHCNSGTKELRALQDRRSGNIVAAGSLHCRVRLVGRAGMACVRRSVRGDEQCEVMQ